MEYQLVNQSPSVQSVIEKSIVEAIAWIPIHRVKVSMAYASVAGMQRLLEIIGSAKQDVSFSWLLGLDDYITQPGVLELCSAMSESTLRVVNHKATSQARFHPKMILFESDHTKKSVAFIGSANLTLNGLVYNSELGTIFFSQSTEDTLSFQNMWLDMWELGHNLSNSEMEEYKKNYTKKMPRKKKRRQSKKPSTKPILTSDEVLVSPQVAKICWIEVGRNTAMGRELEFKSEQALFFGLSPHGGKPQFRRFQVSNGKQIELRLKYQENSMWRLQMNNNIPEVATGLRPATKSGLGRSPFVAVFRRSASFNVFELKFVDINSSDYRTIRDESFRVGCLGSTSTRFYGWF